MFWKNMRLLLQNMFWFLHALRWFLVWLIVSAVKIDATCSSETSIDFEQTTCHYIPEDRILYIMILS
jgi:hypothetical protein